MHFKLSIPDQPQPEHRAAVLGPLAEFNAQNGYPGDFEPVAILLQDGAGETVGGLWGKTSFGWLFVEFLVVPESLRGQNYGSSMMDEAERIARERGCGGAWLTTFTFQARGFYEKRGYELFGALESSPADNVRLFLRKRL